MYRLEKCVIHPLLILLSNLLLFQLLIDFQWSSIFVGSKKTDILSSVKLIVVGSPVIGPSLIVMVDIPFKMVVLFRKTGDPINENSLIW